MIYDMEKSKIDLQYDSRFDNYVYNLLFYISICFIELIRTLITY